MHFSLPGEVQTVARGELFALYVLICEARPMSDIEFVTDNKGVNDKFNGGPKACINSSNCDLYNKLFCLAHEKAVRLMVRWMPSHLKDEDARPVDVSYTDVLGNRHADRLAGLAAAAVQVPNAVSAPYLYHVNLVKKIQRRLVAVTLNLPDKHEKKVEVPKPPKEPAKSLSELIAGSQHVISVINSRLKCSSCRSSFKRTDPGLKHWLQCGCIPFSAAAFATAPRHVPVDTPVHMGNQVSHYTHHLFIYRGLVYCNVCGNRGSNDQLRKLARQCEGPSLPTSYGGIALAAIKGGRLPPRLDQWPD